MLENTVSGSMRISGSCGNTVPSACWSFPTQPLFHEAYLLFFSFEKKKTTTKTKQNAKKRRIM